MKTTALYLSPSGAQRVTVNFPFTDVEGHPDLDGAYAVITDREGAAGVVLRSLLMSFREEEEDD